MKKNAIPATLLLLASPWAASQAVWRCGSSYSQQPCEGGAAISTPAAPSPADAARAAGVAKSDMQRAEAMEKARLAQEKNAPKPITIGPAPAPAPEPGPKPKKVAEKKPAAGKKQARPEEFTAVVPGSGKKHK